MTTKQLGILNSLVTFAAENVPGGLSEDEREVAKIAGQWVLIGMDPVPMERYSADLYKVIRVQEELRSALRTANTRLANAGAMLTPGMKAGVGQAKEICENGIIEIRSVLDTAPDIDRPLPITPNPGKSQS